MSYQAVSTVIIISVLATAAYFDLRWRRIPNWLTYPAILCGLLLHYVYMGLNGLVLSFLGLVVGFGFLFVFFVCHLIGGGDVKLLAAIGALIGVKSMLAVVFWSAFFGAFFSVVFVLWNTYKSRISVIRARREEGAQKNKQKQTFSTIAKKLTVPYGIAI